MAGWWYDRMLGQATWRWQPSHWPVFGPLFCHLGGSPSWQKRDLYLVRQAVQLFLWQQPIAVHFYSLSSPYSFSPITLQTYCSVPAARQMCKSSVSLPKNILFWLHWKSLLCWMILFHQKGIWDNLKYIDTLFKHCWSKLQFSTYTGIISTP